VTHIANGSRANFPFCLVAIESSMIALIDLPNLLWVTNDDKAAA